MALFILPYRLRGVIYDTMGSASDTRKARRGRKRPGQHFRQSRAWNTFPIEELRKIGEEDAKAIFRKLRWPDTDGEPVCPHCGSHDSWELKNQGRWKCKAKTCRKQFSITSGTIFAHRKLSYMQILIAARAFSQGAKGNTGIDVSGDVGCTYKTAYVLQHKFREGMLHSMRDVRLQGEVEIDGGWFGGYIKPENRKVNRVDRRLKANQNRKRRVVVGARERGENGRMIVGVFDGEDQAQAWLSERVDTMALVYADEAPAWDDIHATHKAHRVNHSELYATGERNVINTNQMESFFSRLRRFEIGTHHHISGRYLLRYANDGAWRETNRRVDHRGQTHRILQSGLGAPQSRSFSGYWQRGSANHVDDLCEDVFAAFR